MMMASNKAEAVPRVLHALRWSGVLLVQGFLWQGCGGSVDEEGVSKAASQSAFQALATVGDHRIIPQDLTFEARRMAARGIPVVEKEALLKQVVERQALVQQAKASGIADDPEVRHEMEDLLIAKWRARELNLAAEGAELDEERLREAYEARQSEFITPAKVRLALLRLSTSPGMSAVRKGEVQQRMEAARQQVMDQPARSGRGPAPTGFGALAIDCSDDQASRYRGGDIGWLSTDRATYRWPTNILQAGFDAEKGAVSEVLEDPSGYYLVKKTDERPAVTNDFASVRSALSRQWRVKLQNQRRLDLHIQAVKAYPAQINQAKWAQFELPESTSKTAMRAVDPLPAIPAGP